MKAKFKVGENVVCITKTWFWTGTKNRYDLGPKLHEVVTVVGHVLRSDGVVGLKLSEYIDPDGLGWKEAGFEKLVSGDILEYELSDIKVPPRL